MYCNNFLNFLYLFKREKTMKMLSTNCLEEFFNIRLYVHILYNVYNMYVWVYEVVAKFPLLDNVTRAFYEIACTCILRIAKSRTFRYLFPTFLLSFPFLLSAFLLPFSEIRNQRFVIDRDSLIPHTHTHTCIHGILKCPKKN